MLTPQVTPPSSLSSGTPPGQPEFVELDSSYVCILCRQILRDAVQTPCGHRLCQQCAEDYLREGTPRSCPYQEEHCEALSPAEVQRDSSARREIRQFPVHCSNKARGCEARVKWKDLEKHLSECYYEPLLCPNKDRGCDAVVSRGDLPEHQLTCDYTPTQCGFCGEVLPKLSKETHDNEVCQKIPIRCPYGCGIDPIPRDQMSRHQQTCPRQIVVCKFASMGCRFKGLVEEVALHEKQSMKEHVHQTTQQMANIDLYNLDIQKEIQELNDLGLDIRQKVKDIEKELEEIQHLVKKAKSEGRRRKLDVVDLTERMIHLEKQVEELRPEVLQRIGSDLNILRETVRTERERLDRLVAGQVMGEGATADPTNTRTDPFEDLQKQTRQLGLQEAKLGELDIRFQILETINYNGVLLWKISNYYRKKQDAVAGTTLSIYSSPFFTSRYGYKMCCRAYLNGDGMGKNTHFSIFFVVMQGEYDALLPWPFKQKVTFMILDQSGNRRHLSDSFRPDPNSSSFKRPLAEMNIASGCPLFVSQTILESSNSYVKDDSLFVKVTVDTSGLEPI